VINRLIFYIFGVNKKTSDMPKILIFKDIWIFVIYGADMFENRIHVHVGKKATFKLCKIWLEPEVEISNGGELSQKQQKEVLEIAKSYKNELIQQWKDYIKGQNIKVIKVK
jgi:hypothetical protein